MIIEELNINCEKIFFEEIDFSKALKDIWSLLEISKDKIYVGYDEKKSLCVVATDIYAMRPIYMYKNVITDNIESLAGLEIDETSFDEFLKYGFMVAPKTLYRDLLKLPAGCLLLINTSQLSKEFIPISTPKKSEDSNSFEYLMANHCFSFPSNLNTFDTALAFSGGLDSSLILNSLYQQNIGASLITVNVEGGRDESYYQNIVNEKIGYDHYKYEMSEDDALSTFRRLCNDKEILGHPIVLKYDFLSECAKSSGFKTLITGEGSDDLFVWNDSHPYVNAVKAEILPVHPKISNYSNIITLPFYQSNSINETACRLMNFGLMANANYYFLHKSAAKRNLKLLLPYLDLQLIRYSLLNADTHSLQNKKYLLSTYARGRLPEEVINRKKMGFRSDAELWFKKGHAFYNELMVLLTQVPDSIYQVHERSRMLLNEIQSTGSKKSANALFCVMMLLGWIKENFKIKGDK